MRRDLRLRLGSNGLDRAARLASAAITPWLLVDEAQLGIELERALVVFPGNGRRRPDLVASLERLKAARQMLVTRSRRDILCIFVYRRGDRDRLFEATESFGEPFLWDEVIDESRRLEADLWTALAGSAAREEGLLIR